MIGRQAILKEVQKKLGVQFNDEELLDIGLTHSSYANGKKNVFYNERLEFLGDSVLQLCVSEYLFVNYSKKTEGELTRKRALVVCENSLYEVAKTWEIGQYINMSKGEELTGGRERVSILADCVEAVIAAIFLDRGFDVSRDFIINNFKEVIDRAIKDKIVLDYKTKLQETMQQKGEVLIEYDLLKHEGPPHKRKFFTQVVVDRRILGEGSGFSKKESQQNAAHEALTNIDDKNE